MPKWIPLLHNPKELKKLYAKHTVRQIAVKVSCVPAAVTQALHRHGIPTRPAVRPSPIELKDKEWMEKQYAKYSSRQIAAALGCDMSTVLDALNRHGIKRDVKRRRPRPPTVNTKYRYKVVNGKLRKVHRLIMEDHLGRALRSDEHVHHIDGDPGNNDLSNLVVLSRGEHAKLHFGRQHRREFSHICENCKKAFVGGNKAKRCPPCRDMA